MTSVLLFIAMRDDLELVGVGRRRGRGIVPHHRRRVSRRQLRQGPARADGFRLLLASLVYGVMWIWHRGAVEVQRSVEAALTPLSSLLEELHAGEVARVPGTAVFFSRVKDQTPPVLGLGTCVTTGRYMNTCWR